MNSTKTKEASGIVPEKAEPNRATMNPPTGGTTGYEVRQKATLKENNPSAESSGGEMQECEIAGLPDAPPNSKSSGRNLGTPDKPGTDKDKDKDKEEDPTAEALERKKETDKISNASVSRPVEQLENEGNNPKAQENPPGPTTDGKTK